MTIRASLVSCLALLALFASMSGAAAQTSSWTGLYVGGSLGGGEIDTDYGHPPPNAHSFSIDASGLIGGGIAGYNWQANGFVFGVEGDFSFANNMDGALAGRPDHVKEVDWLATIRGRAGFLVSPHALVYGTAGVAWLKEEFTHIGHHTWDQTFVGYVVGGGGEMQVAQHVNLGVEALYFNFDEESNTHPHGEGTHTMTGDPSGYVVRGRLVFPFGGRTRDAPPLK